MADEMQRAGDIQRKANTVPVQQKRERAGEHILFNARLRSRIAKQRGDALGDLAQGDVDYVGRYSAPAEIGTGGELVPQESELRDTVTNPDYVTVDASRDRLELASLAGVLELGLDASDSINARNSLEKMMVHQMAAVHRQIMKLTARMDDIALMQFPHHEGFQQKNVEVCRLGATMARLTACFQSGLLALQRVRAGGRQVVTVQHVHVAEGGQAVFAAKINGKGGGGTPAERRRGASRNGE
jgi:hypothetical protein